MHLLCSRLESGETTWSRFAAGTGVTTPDPFEVRASSWVLAGTFLPANHAILLETTTKILEASTMAESQRHNFLSTLQREHKLKMSGSLRYRCESFVMHLQLPMFVKCQEADLRIKAQLRCAAVGLAIEQFRLRFSRWPNSLGELPKDMLSTIPSDPFDGQPLRYIKRPDGVTVYSIGVDGDDNGGIMIPSKGSSDRRKDVGFRLYNLDQRRLPPLPPPSPRIEDLEWELGPEPREVKDQMS
jgi:hypothetical protein